MKREVVNLSDVPEGGFFEYAERVLRRIVHPEWSHGLFGYGSVREDRVFTEWYRHMTFAVDVEDGMLVVFDDRDPSDPVVVTYLPDYASEVQRSSAVLQGMRDLVSGTVLDSGDAEYDLLVELASHLGVELVEA